MTNILIRSAAALLLALTAFTAACSTTPPPRPSVEAEPEKHTYNNGSLWPGATKKNILFSDNKASRIGDIVTVHIIEKTTALNKSDTSDSSSLDNSISLDTGSVTPTEIKLGGGKKYTGRGSTGRSDQFSATVSCVVTEVLGNGNMLVEGQRRMAVNNEEQYILVRGMVRPDDIKYNNTVLSSQMADVDIQYTGGGGMDSGKAPGWLGKALNKVWPF
ncbi:MAG: flagellar basal body L-ring protein FlgH [Nitrospinae bacterium]|nr:flagellar basal body L-ring protein FlgH [Nitrospinota bacterium]